MRTCHVVALALIAAASMGLPVPHAEAAGKIDCEMRFNLSGWAAIYKHAEGHGTITCNNGRSFKVNIVAVGGGPVAGSLLLSND